MKKLYKSLSFTAALLLMLASVALAQERVVSGTVTDETGSGMPGVNVLVKGTSTGTATDVSGKFSLSVPGNDAVLVFTFVGYTSQEETVGTRSTIDVSMKQDASTLEEVVVTGYTSERKQDLVSAVSQVSAGNTVAIPVSSVDQAIQGRVAGVQVTTSGQPGAQASVRIRGFGSFGGNGPLYVVDGVPTFDVSNLNPYDIETTTILKDAGAASIYGSRAASGVIVYTTKHGKNDGKTRIDLDVSYGLNFPGKGIKMLNPTEQANKVYEALRNTTGGTSANQPYGSDLNNPVVPDYINVGVFTGGVWKPTGNIMEGDPRIDIALQNYNVNPDNGLPIVQVVKANKSGTDWYKEMTRVAPVARYSLGMSGGTDRSHYYLNASLYNQQGITLNVYNKRYNVRMNSEFKPHKDVRIGENLNLSYIDNPQIGNQQSENQLNLAYRMPTIIPVYDVNGGYAGTQAPGFNNPANPVASLKRLSKNYNQTNAFQGFGNFFIEVDPIKHLTLRSSYGGNVNYGYAMQYIQKSYENAENIGKYTLNENAAYWTNWIFTNTARYDNKFGDHTLKVLVGYEAIKNNATGRGLAGQGSNPFSNSPDFISISNSSPSGRQSGSGIFQPSTLASIFGKIDYNWKDKYYVSATVRRDGSSKFGSQNRYGVFPAFSGAWRISQENFIHNVSWIDDLKIRGGWGQMGNQTNINSTNQFTLYANGPQWGYDITGSNNSVTPGFVPQQVGNTAGQWEVNTTTNIGLDGTFMHGTLEVVAEFWQKKTDKLLFNPNIYSLAGIYQQNPYVNIASMTNKGIDLQIIKRFKAGNDWNVTLDGNIAPIQNKINKLAPGYTYFTTGQFRNINFIRNEEGHSISSFYGYQQTGYFQDAADVTNSATQDGAAPGRFKFKDQNGDGVIDDKDRVFMGSPVPKFTYGLNINVKYKRFSFDMFFYGKYGNKLINFSKWYNGFYSSFSGAGLAAITKDSWTPERGNGAKTPIIESASNFSTNTQSNSWYVESGSYLRCKNLQLNYEIPGSALGKLGLTNLRIYAQLVNAFTITKYTGKDPEVASSVDTTLGVDVGNYPATRIWSLGLHAGF